VRNATTRERAVTLAKVNVATGVPRRAVRPRRDAATVRHSSVYKRGADVSHEHQRATAAGASGHIRNGFISFGARARDPKQHTATGNFVIARKAPEKMQIAA